MQLPEAARSPVNAAMGKQHGKNNVFPHYMTQKVQKVAVGEEVFFYLGEPARLSSRRFQASQTHIHGSTLRNVVSSRRAVGLSATMVLAIRFRRGVCDTPLQTLHVWAYRIRPHAKTISASIPLARPFATFPRFAANHPIPSPASFPAPRTRVRTFYRNNGNIARIRLQTCNP